MADAIVGTGHNLTTAQWSTTGASTTLGIVLSMEYEPVAESEPIPNAAAGEQGRLFFNKGKTITMECACKSGGVLPSPGDTLTLTSAVGAVSGVVMSAKHSAKQRGWQVFQITIEKRDAMSL